MTATTLDERTKLRRQIATMWPLAVAVVLFVAYVRMARAIGGNADAASNALQSWDMLHGNVLLRGWTVTDVPFYTNELLLFAIVELVYGYHGDVIRVAAGLTYTLLVLVVAAVAKGHATGREAAFRVGTAVALVAVPVFGLNTSVVLNSPDHTGTAVPLLLAWLVFDRRPQARWLPYALAVMLAWGQISDPLVMYIGALPLLLVGALHRRLPLILAAIGSVVLAQGVLLVIRLAGGFGSHPPTTAFSPLDELPGNLWVAVQALAGNFGAYFPDRHGPVAVAIGVLHLVGLLVALGTVAIVALRAVRRRGNPVDEVIAAGVLVNLGAFVVSTLPGDLGTSRQIIAVLPLSAVLVGRLWGPRLADLGRRAAPALAAVLLVLAVELAAQATARPVPVEGTDVAEWLDRQGLDYGIGAYWFGNSITLITSGRVRVAPVAGGGEPGAGIRALRWESRADWYDPARHDARFLVVDRDNPSYGTEEQARAQFGAPVARQDFARATVLVYDRNLLVGLPADCVPEIAPSMADCPRHRFPMISG